MFDILIFSPEEKVLEGKASSLIVPGENGVFEILPYHKPVLSRIVGGDVIVDGRVYSIRRGLVGFNRNKATVIIEK